MEQPDIAIEQYFFTNILSFDVDSELADRISACVTPAIKDLKETNPNNQHKSDYGEESILGKVGADNTCIDEITNKFLELGNVYISTLGLGSFKRYLSAWVNSYDGTQYKGMHNHCRNVNDVHGIYYVEADESQSPLIIHHPSPFMQGQPINTEYNYSAAQLKVNKGRIYMMPSWLMHEVRANTSNEPADRISIGFKYEQVMKDSYEDEQYILEHQEPYERSDDQKPYAGSPSIGKFDKKHRYKEPSSGSSKFGTF